MKNAVALLIVALVLSGCSGGGGGDADVIEDVPEEIDRKRLEDVESELLSKFPRRFSFAGQEALETVTVFFNDTISAGTGSGSPEVPDDTGVVEVNPTFIAHDVAPHAPEGQPVEMRIKLKWWGNPGSAGDLDIFVDVPGMRDAHDPDSFDESNNWNIVTKFKVVNTARIEGLPFDVGVQVSNGRILVDDMPYSLRVDLAFASDVLAPGIPYAVTVPANASRLVFESEPVTGDEHITGEFMVIDPENRMHRHMHYDDIGVDARVIATPRPGEYVLYAPTLRGGFLKVFTDVPNENFNARILTREEHSAALATNVLPPTGGEGTFDLESFPLEMHPWIRPTGPAGAAGAAALNLTSESGWVATAVVEGRVSGDAMGRVGNNFESSHNYENLRSGSFGWTVEGSAAAGMDAGYRYVTYVR